MKFRIKKVYTSNDPVYTILDNRKGYWELTKDSKGRLTSFGTQCEAEVWIRNKKYLTQLPESEIVAEIEMPDIEEKGGTVAQ